MGAIAATALIMAFWSIPAPDPAPLLPFATESELQTMPRSAMANSGGISSLRFDPSGKYLGFLTLGSGAEFWKIPLDGRFPEEMLQGSAGTLIGHFNWLSQGAGIIESSAESHRRRLARQFSVALAGWRHVGIRQRRTGLRHHRSAVGRIGGA